MHPDHPVSTVCCSMLPVTCPSSKPYALDGTVENTCLPPVQPKLSFNAVDPTSLGEWGDHSSLQGQPSASLLFWSQPNKTEGLARESYSSSDSVQYISEASQVVHGPSIPYTLNKTTRNAELGLARAGDPYIWVLQDAVHEAGAPSNVRNICPISRGSRSPASYFHLQENQYASRPTTPCLYPGVEGKLCLQDISCATVPSHFTGHGIGNRSRKEVIRCSWEGCVKKITRHTFARHIREVHLRHVRGTGAHSLGTIQGGSLAPSGDPIYCEMAQMALIIEASDFEYEYVRNGQYFESASHQ
ncbi:hypothetical protein EDD17DRAFT_1506705 [Pisolithus thermaeus]|nr:hypothetical protein EDD17DRAFT_1506705 [Pisolithus thermaeus]